MKLLMGFRFACFAVLVVQGIAMFNKRGLPDLTGVAPQKRFRRNVADLFLSNDVSGHRSLTVLEDARLAGAEHVSDLVRGQKERKHANRNLLRRLLKGKEWCKPYYALIRCWNPHTQQTERKWLPFLLPHELVWCLQRKNDLDTLLVTDGMCDESLLHLASIKQKVADSILALGIWTDGCPCNWDRSQTLETWTMNLPGLLGHAGEMRLPVCVILKRFCVKYETADDICQVLCWSLECLARGTFPSRRHDGTPWNRFDVWRKRKASRSIGVKAALVEIRGDWKMLQETFRLPSWSSATNICFKCSAGPKDLRRCGLDAPWRNQRKGPYDALADILERSETLSPLFSSPWFSMSIFRLDWLHIADLGTTADFIGSLFSLILLPRMPGTNDKSRCSSLFLQIKRFYDSAGTENRINNLTLPMFKGNNKKKQGFKLKAGAAECRGLVPFCKEMCHQLLSEEDVLENTVIQATDALNDMYDCLAEANFNSVRMAETCRRFCLLQVALEQTCPTAKGWRVKPKMHLLQELCECTDNRPSQMWTYRDESFGGDVAKIARSRGGHCTPMAVGNNVLLKFLAKHPVPVFH